MILLPSTKIKPTHLQCCQRLLKTSYIGHDCILKSLINHFTSSSSQVQTVRRCSLWWETAVLALWAETLLCCSVISPREPPTGSSPFWTPCGLQVEHARCHLRRGGLRAATLAEHPLTPLHPTAEITCITQTALSPCALSAWLLFGQLHPPLSGTRLCRPCWLLTTC